MCFIERSSISNHLCKRMLAREIGRMISRRFYFGACIVLPLFSLFFMSTIFNDGQMNNMPVGIVDMDQTAMSREISRSAAAVPQLDVTKYYVSEVEARADVQNKLIYGYLVIPPDFESDAILVRTTTFCYYYYYWW